jgi:hypothetical protein
MSQSAAEINLKYREQLNLLFVLHGYETWPLTLREESRLRVFYSRAMRNIHGSTKNEVTVEWRRLRNEELRVMYSLPYIIRLIESRGM